MAKVKAKSRLIGLWKTPTEIYSSDCVIFIDHRVNDRSTRSMLVIQYSCRARVI